MYSGLVALAFTFSGCGGNSDEASCRFEVQQNLDTGNFAAVIAELNNPSSACLATYAASDFQIDLGAAYMGQAGLSITDIVGLVTADTGSSDAFASLIEGVTEQQSDSALDNLGKAAEAYTLGLEGVNCTSLTITPSQQDICLFIGLAETMRATTTISYLVDDVTILFDDTDPIAQTAAQEEMTAAICALQFINQGSQCLEATVVATDVNFTYADVNSTQKTFSDITVTMSAFPNNKYHELGTALAFTPGTTIVTDGYCENNFSSPSDIWSLSSPYACPLNKDPTIEDESIVTLLVETLNGGLEAILGAIDDPELEADVNEYLLEINTDANATISIVEIQDYLNNL